jgi:hypothetical protein
MSFKGKILIPLDTLSKRIGKKRHIVALTDIPLWSEQGEGTSPLDEATSRLPSAISPSL